jgi:DNA-binding CsgD family transcriptional regulator
VRREGAGRAPGFSHPDARRSEPLLEREAEVTALRIALSAASEGAGGVAMIEAGPGLGKSRLLAVAEELAPEHGMEVLLARAGELEASQPYGVALQLFERRLRGAAEGEREQLLAGAAGLAGRLFAPPAGAAADRGGEEDLSVIHGLHWLTANLAEDRPLALLVDDAHWVDPLSLRYLAYLANRIGDLPVALVVATRPPSRSADGDLLLALAAHPATRVLRPAPLGVAGAARLLDHHGLGTEPLDEQFTGACFRATGGNPFLLRELAIALLAEGLGPDAGGAARAREIGPEPVSRAVSLSLARLPRAATILARSLAVLGERSEPALARELAGLDEEDAAGAAGALTAAGILQRNELLAFEHPIIRAALYEELAPAERALAHRHAARLLRVRGAEPDRVAAHLLRVEPSGAQWVVDSLLKAAERDLERGAPAAAAIHLERALREGAGDRGELLLALARARATAGDPAASTAYEEAVEGVADGRERAGLLRELSRCLYLQGRFEESAAASERGAEALNDPDDPLALHLAAGRSAALLWAGGVEARPFDELESLLERARGATSLPERAVLANLAGAEMMRGEDRGRALELARLAWGDGALQTEGPTAEPAVLAITAALGVGEDYAGTIEVAETMLTEARRRGLIASFATFSYVRAWALLYLGRIDEAIADVESALATRAYGWRLFAAGAMCVGTISLIERGDLDAAAETCAVGPEEDELRATPAYGGLLIARAELALTRGEAAGAIPLLRSAREQLEGRLGVRNSAWFDWLAALARGLAQAGERDEAIAAAEDNLERVRRWGASRAISEGLRARGLAAGGEAGIPWLEQAVAAAAEAPSGPLAHARALVDLGTAQRATGKRRVALDSLRLGLDAASRCGARGLAARAREELVIAGARPRREQLSGVDSLTPGERRVAEMAAAGMTNRQIAEALFVTVKAVEYHLRNTYRKLDIRGRPELASALGQVPT